MVLGLRIIGDEIPPGKRADKHFAQIRQILAARQLALAWVRRLRMGEFSRSKTLIPNPYYRIPGFSIQRHCLVPGFPELGVKGGKDLSEPVYGQRLSSFKDIGSNLEAKLPLPAL
jgi:molybdopterin-biosynthesis enzyme MoeA-like protein